MQEPTGTVRPLAGLLRGHLVDQRVHNVLLVGVLDQDETPWRFMAHTDWLYLELDAGLLELRCVDLPLPGLQLSLVHEPDLEVPWADGMPACVSTARTSRNSTVSTIHSPSIRFMVA